MNDLTENPTVLNVRDVSVSYQTSNATVQAINKVNLELLQNEMIAIVGESGSGKTTLLSAIAGIIPIDSGEITIFGKPYLNGSYSKLRETRSTLQLIPQNASGSFDPRYPIGDSLFEALHWLRSDLTTDGKRLAVNCAIDATRIDKHLLSRLPGQLSGGQLKRASIARAIVVQPKVLMLDEAFSGLNEEAQEEMAKQLAKLQDNYEMSIILVSHSTLLVGNITDRIAVMKSGSLVKQTLPKTLGAKPQCENRYNIITTSDEFAAHAPGTELKQ